MIFKGYIIALLELLGFGLLSHHIKESNDSLQTMNPIAYYWMMFTILTGFWEYVFVSNYETVVTVAKQYISTKQHTWTNNYDLSYVLPWKLSKIFYAEYGAWADREYMNRKNSWSRIIESSHELCCGLFSLLSLYSLSHRNTNSFLICFSVSMGTQFMNSLLYMANYKIQTTDKDNVNYNSPSWPSGVAYCHRPFMWINYFWMIMPAYSIITLFKSY